MTIQDSKAHFESQYKKRAFFSPHHILFAVYDKPIWTLTADLLKKSRVVVDLGCGGGTVLYNISKISNARLVGVDFSDLAGAQLRQLVPRSTFLKEDVTRTTLADGSCDFVVSTMTVEHVDDRAFFAEAFRILEPGGFLFVTSVIKKEGAVYFYKNKNNEYSLEPSHLREYASEKDFFDKLTTSDFQILKAATSRIRFPLIDPLLKCVFGSVSNSRLRSLPASPFFEWIRLRTQIPIPGFKAIEVVAQKRVTP